MAEDIYIPLDELPAHMNKMAADLAAVTAQRDALLEAMREISKAEGDAGATDCPDYITAVACMGSIARSAISAAERKA